MHQKFILIIFPTKWQLCYLRSEVRLQRAAPAPGLVDSAGLSQWSLPAATFEMKENLKQSTIPWSQLVYGSLVPSTSMHRKDLLQGALMPQRAAVSNTSGPDFGIEWRPLLEVFHQQSFLHGYLARQGLLSYHLKSGYCNNHLQFRQGLPVKVGCLAG